MSVTNANPNYPTAPLVFLAGVTATGAGTWQNVTHRSLLRLEVFGTWVGRIVIEGYVGDNSRVYPLLCNHIEGGGGMYITRRGVYEIDVAAFAGIRARVDIYTSGSMSVTGIFGRGQARRGGQYELFEATSASVAAGATLDITGSTPFYVGGFTYYKAMIKADSAGDFALRVLPYPRPNTTLTNFDDYIPILVGNLRGTSEEFLPDGQGSKFNIQNTDTGSHTYNLVVEAWC